MEDNLERFLTVAGYANEIELFTNQGVTSVTAARGLSLEELIDEVGCKKLVAKKIYDQLHPSADQESPVDPNHGAIVPMQMQMMQMQFNNTQQVAQLQAQMQLMEANQKNAEQITALKHEHAMLLLRKDLEHQATTHKLQMEKAKVESDGKLALAEEKNKASAVQPVVYGGPWDRLYPYPYPVPAGSILLTPHFFRMIQTWLGTPRSWDLRYRASRDGFGLTAFHSRCDNIGATVTIISANGYLFGGYASGSWDSSSGWGYFPGSFLFTLTNAHGTSPTVFHQKTSANTIYRASSHAQTFGGGHDIYISDNSNGNTNSYSNFPNSYNDTLGHGNNTFAGSKNFTVSDIEVFRVI